MKSKLLLIITFITLLSCGPDERSINYKNSEIAGIVDSLIYYKPLDTKKFFFLLNGHWYVVPGRYYVSFFHYLDKGDSLYKDAGRWDIYVYKKKKGKWVEKYFRGAQDSWK